MGMLFAASLSTLGIMISVDRAAADLWVETTSCDQEFIDGLSRSHVRFAVHNAAVSAIYHVLMFPPRSVSAPGYVPRVYDRSTAQLVGVASTRRWCRMEHPVGIQRPDRLQANARRIRGNFERDSVLLPRHPDQRTHGSCGQHDLLLPMRFRARPPSARGEP